MSQYSAQVAKAGLEIPAIKLDPITPFVWASGFQMPIYNDNRSFLFYPEYQQLISSAFIHLMDQEKIPCDVVAGTSTAGIPWAAIVAYRLGRPMVYIRDKPKDHGLRNRIEGLPAERDLEGRSVVLIEDLISTGGSSASAVQGVREANGDCRHCISVFDYGLDKAVEAFASLTPPCEVRSLLRYDTLLEVAQATGFLTVDQASLLQEWREDPFGWGEKHGFPKIERSKS